MQTTASDMLPREKAMAFGCHSLTTAELFALLLGSGVRGYNILDLCRDLINSNGGTLTRLSQRTLKELTAMKGLGSVKALQVLAVMEIARRFQRETLPEKHRIASSMDAYHEIKPELASLDHEQIWIICLNRANRVICKYHVSSGTATSTLFDVKKIVKKALLEGAEALMMCHNHPSGNLHPSGADDGITRKCKEACALFDIRMLDHIIVTTNGYYSYADQGKL